MTENTTQKFDTEIYSDDKIIYLGLQELWNYKDLVKMFIKRNFTALYKQTILGPIWIVLNPLITSVVFTFIFGELAGISTDGAPQLLFYMSGNILWTFFSTTTNNVAGTFFSNMGMYSKVYFARLTVPIATTFTGLISFLLQFVFYFIFFAFYIITGSNVSISPTIVLVPLVILQIMLISMGVGLTITSITAKYRDLVFVFPFLIQILMYLTPVVYPSSTLSGFTKVIVLLNPVSTAVEVFRYSLLNVGVVNWGYWYFSWFTTIVLFFVGVITFRKREKSFVDVI